LNAPGKIAKALLRRNKGWKARSGPKKYPRILRLTLRSWPITACGFHDLVGQRLTKITETLDCVIASRLTGEKPARTKASGKRGSEIALEGPSHNSAAQDQGRIDTLFAEKN
jgi:hypothetical protein